MRAGLPPSDLDRYQIHMPLPPNARTPIRPPARERTGKTIFARELIPPAPTSSFPVRVTVVCDLHGNGSDEQRTKTIRGWPLRGAEAAPAAACAAGAKRAHASARTSGMRRRAAIIGGAGGGAASQPA